MKTRTLGSSQLRVSELGLGCMGMSWPYHPVPDRKEMTTLLRAAVDRGITFFDTAEVYGPHTNEDLVGEAQAPVRSQVVLATKFGWRPAVPEVLPTLQELGIGFVPFSPLGKGFLTGRIDETTTFDSADFRNSVPRFTPENRKANQVLVELLRTTAQRRHATPGQVALAWLLVQKPWIVPIPGTTKQHRLEENIGAADVELAPDDLDEIERAASEFTIQGARYPEQLERLSNR